MLKTKAHQANPWLTDLIKPDDFQLADEGSYEGLELEGYDFSGGHYGALDFHRCHLKNCRLRQLTIDRLSLVEVRLDNCDLANLETEETYLQTVVADKCRFTGAVCGAAVIKQTDFIATQLELARFRLAKIKGSRFIDCRLAEADFYGSTLEQVAFANSYLAQAEFSGTKNSAVDFRTSDLAGLHIGLESLRGTIISQEQVYDLAWLLGAKIE